MHKWAGYWIAMIMGVVFCLSGVGAIVGLPLMWTTEKLRQEHCD